MAIEEAKGLDPIPQILILIYYQGLFFIRSEHPLFFYNTYIICTYTLYIKIIYIYIAHILLSYIRNQMR